MNILLIKLGALGDVLRTTPLLTAWKNKFPGCRITWVVGAPHLEVLRRNRLIDHLMDSSEKSLQEISARSFDLAVNLDKEPEATGFLRSAVAKKKMGFARDAKGNICAADPLSEYAVRLGIDDELKFRMNKKTYQQISFEQVGLTFDKEEYLFELDDESLKQASRILGKLSRPVVGLNTGAGNRFAGKKLPRETCLTIARRLHRELGATVLLLGGKDERERNEWIAQRSGEGVLDTGSHSLNVFAGLVRHCDLVISGDTTAMHIAIAVKTPVVSYFASTCAQEIEMYGRGRKIVSGISCAPCYKKDCPIDEKCMKDMTADQILREVGELLTGHATRIP